MNKFLKKYPQLRDPQQGDVIEITITSIFNILYKRGCIGVIIAKSSDHDKYIIDFRGLNDNQYGYGIYVVDKKEFKIIKITDE